MVREGTVEEVAFEQRHESTEGGDSLGGRAVQVEGAAAGRPEAASAGAGRWWRRGSRAPGSAQAGFAEFWVSF